MKIVCLTVRRGGLYIGSYAMWTRTAAGPESDGDREHVDWVGRVKNAVGPAALGLYVNEVGDSSWTYGIHVGADYGSNTIHQVNITVGNSG